MVGGFLEYIPDWWLDWIMECTGFLHITHSGCDKWDEI